jgi:hypothetical protein
MLLLKNSMFLQSIQQYAGRLTHSERVATWVNVVLTSTSGTCARSAKRLNQVHLGT